MKSLHRHNSHKEVQKCPCTICSTSGTPQNMALLAQYIMIVCGGEERSNFEKFYTFTSISFNLGPAFDKKKDSKVSIAVIYDSVDTHPKFNGAYILEYKALYCS